MFFQVLYFANFDFEAMKCQADYNYFIMWILLRQFMIHQSIEPFKEKKRKKKKNTNITIDTQYIHNDLPIDRNKIVMILDVQRNIICQNLPVVYDLWVFSFPYKLKVLFITFLFLGKFTKRFKQSSILIIGRLVWNFCGGVIYRWGFGFFLAELFVPTRWPKYYDRHSLNWMLIKPGLKQHVTRCLEFTWLSMKSLKNRFICPVNGTIFHKIPHSITEWVLIRFKINYFSRPSCSMHYRAKINKMEFILGCR